MILNLSIDTKDISDLEALVQLAHTFGPLTQDAAAPVPPVSVETFEAAALVQPVPFETPMVAPEVVAPVPPAPVPPAPVETPEAVAPVPPAPAAPVTPGEPVLDGRGVAWSSEYHAATQTMKKDGSWKAKKGSDKNALAVYEATFLSGAPVEPVASAPVAPAASARVEETNTDILRKHVAGIIEAAQAPTVAGLEMLQGAGIQTEGMDNLGLFDAIAAHYQSGSFATLDEFPDQIDTIQMVVDIVWAS